MGWPYKRGTKSALIRGVAFGGGWLYKRGTKSALIRGVAFGGGGCIRGELNLP